MTDSDDDYPYAARTEGFVVRVRPVFLDDQSDEADGKYLWGYEIRVENHGDVTAQLRSRHWIITDGNGMVQEVTGDGVVGEQPTLEPGEAFTYGSGCPLNTPTGFMAGRYQMVAEDGRAFEIDIPAFSLDSPYARRTLN
ncbi:Co2+/Mg2+ efflux protein ApaG [Hankyongella ginsenosidimutans]|uniref:Protein ApaG n=1 Tax=Hankyongella ginsenosidimutans TaxID=1763828 RepID=A0A4D7C9Q6_9SPHN|nr:Co2+/Mg2+ efflux protein ApaG [Hankyongella ginsenosidimutans]QCI79723.1 Co2+/Mg2+ efflux protein ApaG [Hankyongella ginsenosidimutans]